MITSQTFFNSLNQLLNEQGVEKMILLCWLPNGKLNITIQSNCTHRDIVQAIHSLIKTTYRDPDAAVTIDDDPKP